MGEEVRLLARASQYGYTDRVARALRHEPEAIGAEDQRALSARARRTQREHELAQWRERRQVILRELDWLRSQRFMRDVRTQVRALQRQLDRIDVKLQRG